MAETHKLPHIRRRWYYLLIIIILLSALGIGFYTQWPHTKQSDIESLKQEVARLTRSLVELNQKLSHFSSPDLSPIEARLQALETQPASTTVSSTTASAFETLMLFQVFEWTLAAGQDIKAIADQLVRRIPDSESLITALKAEPSEQTPSKLLKPFQKFVSIQTLRGQNIDKAETLGRLKKLVYEQFIRELK